jgi:hypothetical protein
MFMVLVFYGDENVSQVTIVNDVCVCTYMQEEDNTPWDPLPGYCSVHLHLREENNSPKLSPSLPPSLPLTHSLSHTLNLSLSYLLCSGRRRRRRSRSRGSRRRRWWWRSVILLWI